MNTSPTLLRPTSWRATQTGHNSRSAHWLCLVIRGYQKVRSGTISPCRHVPGCSTYAIEAIETYGSVRGFWLALKRICRCHPWGTSGYDPVPSPQEPKCLT